MNLMKCLERRCVDFLLLIPLVFKFCASLLNIVILHHVLFNIIVAGKIRSIQVNDDAVGRSVEETLRVLRAFQWAGFYHALL